MALLTSSRRPAADGGDAGVEDGAVGPPERSEPAGLAEAVVEVPAMLRNPGGGRDAHDYWEAGGKRRACSVRYSISSGIDGTIQSK